MNHEASDSSSSSRSNSILRKHGPRRFYFSMVLAGMKGHFRWEPEGRCL